MNFRAGALLGGLILLTSAAAFVSVVPREYGGDLVRELDKCLNTDSSSILVTAPEERCARTVLDNHTSNAASAVDFTTLRGVYLANEALKRHCHLLDHYLGSILAQRSSSTAADLGRIAVDECSTGLLHGYLEEIGRSAPAPATVQELIYVCEALPERQLHSCADGIGHLLYTQNPDIFTTAASCGMFTDPAGTIVCSYGVLMAASRVLRFQGVPDFPDLSPELMPTLCARWPSPGVLGQYGCGAGLGLLLTVDLRSRTRSADVAEVGAPAILTDELTVGELSLDVLQDVYASCMELRSAAGRLGCLAEVVRQLRSRQGSQSPGGNLCSNLPDGYAVVCAPEVNGPAVLYSTKAHEHVPTRFGDAQR